MDPRIGSLHIKNFRAFRDLNIEHLGRVNLITGKNNTGKSSVLEALRILASGGAPMVLSSILGYREEDFDRSEYISRSVDLVDVFVLSGLFHGYPAFEEEIAPVEISVGDDAQMRLTLTTTSYSSVGHVEGNMVYTPDSRSHAEGVPVPGLSITVGSTSRSFPIDAIPFRPQLGRAMSREPVKLTHKFISARGEERIGSLGPLWDQIVLSQSEEEVIEALKIIDPTISGISMIGGEGGNRSREALVRSDALPRPIPLRSFGDGLNRLFGIILNVVCSQGGLLLIDEFENGMHHTVQTEVWRVVFNLAKRLDVQVFATSHSWDAIEAFQEAANEDPEEGVLIRLTRRGDDIIPTLFNEEELAIATRHGIEVR